jgi:hypothetical protein
MFFVVLSRKDEREFSRSERSERNERDKGKERIRIRDEDTK